MMDIVWYISIAIAGITAGLLWVTLGAYREQVIAAQRTKAVTLVGKMLLQKFFQLSPMVTIEHYAQLNNTGREALILNLLKSFSSKEAILVQKHLHSVQDFMEEKMHLNEETRRGSRSFTTSI